MIDLKNDDLLTLAQAASQIPGRNGNKCSLQTLYRWCYRGVSVGASRVRLESTLIGGRRFTSQEALSRFVSRLNPPSADENGTPIPRSIDRRRSDSAKAAAELRARQAATRRGKR
jgi:hypothetical protein